LIFHISYFQTFKLNLNLKHFLNGLQAKQSYAQMFIQIVQTASTKKNVCCKHDCEALCGLHVISHIMGCVVRFLLVMFWYEHKLHVPNCHTKTTRLLPTGYI